MGEFLVVVIIIVIVIVVITQARKKHEGSEYKECLRKAESGDLEAMRELSLNLSGGYYSNKKTGWPRDDTLAVYWANKEIENTRDNISKGKALTWLGSIYLDNFNDTQKARECYQKSLDLGYAASRDMLERVGIHISITEYHQKKGY